MNTIWKYPFQITDRQVIEMPQDAQLLTVQMQHGEPCLWALVNPHAANAGRNIVVLGTGHVVPDRIVLHGPYIGTIQINGGSLIFHVFDDGEDR